MLLQLLLPTKLGSLPRPSVDMAPWQHLWKAYGSERGALLRLAARQAGSAKSAAAPLDP